MKSHTSYQGLYQTVMRFKDLSTYSFTDTEKAGPGRIYYNARNAKTNLTVKDFEKEYMYLLLRLCPLFLEV